ncbi:uncharacterized protein HKW66_Vig0055780 [Vigna angularis]|uniref:Uncharacterized protein n=1 Tax=Phaseolus angularis TaxID=3914 RepID=A0A8T0L428_PHAAN|nr:uncharacterized protein HKW66_Vig0055780 [Vigna angularis]
MAMIENKVATSVNPSREMGKRRKKPYTFLEGEEEGGVGGVDDATDIENVMRWLLSGEGCSKVGAAPWLSRVEREGEEG